MMTVQMEYVSSRTDHLPTMSTARTAVHLSTRQIDFLVTERPPQQQQNFAYCWGYECASLQMGNEHER